MRVLQYLIIVSVVGCILGAPNGPAKDLKITRKSQNRPSSLSSESSNSSDSNESSSDDRSADLPRSVDIEKAARSTYKKQSLNTSDESDESSESSSSEIKSSESSSGEQKLSKWSSKSSNKEDKSLESEINAKIHEDQKSSTSKSSKYNNNSKSRDETKKSSEDSSRSLESEESESYSIESINDSEESDETKEESGEVRKCSNEFDSKVETNSRNKTSDTNTSKFNTNSNSVTTSSSSESADRKISEHPKGSKEFSQNKGSDKKSDESSDVPKEFWEFWKLWESWKKWNGNNRNTKRNNLVDTAVDSSKNIREPWNPKPKNISRDTKETSGGLQKDKELDRQEEETSNHKSLNHERQMSEQSSDNSTKARDFNAILKITTEINSWKTSTELSLMRLIIEINGYALSLQNTSYGNVYQKGCEVRQFIIERAIANLDRHAAGVTKNFRHAVMKCNSDLKKTATQLHANIRILGDAVLISGKEPSSNIVDILQLMHDRVELTIKNLRISLLRFFHNNEKLDVTTSGSQSASAVQSPSSTSTGSVATSTVHNSLQTPSVPEKKNPQAAPKIDADQSSKSKISTQQTAQASESSTLTDSQVPSMTTTQLGSSEGFQNYGNSSVSPVLNTHNDLQTSTIKPHPMPDSPISNASESASSSVFQAESGSNSGSKKEWGLAAKPEPKPGTTSTAGWPTDIGLATTQTASNSDRQEIRGSSVSSFPQTGSEPISNTGWRPIWKPMIVSSAQSQSASQLSAQSSAGSSSQSFINKSSGPQSQEQPASDVSLINQSSVAQSQGQAASDLSLINQSSVHQTQEQNASDLSLVKQSSTPQRQGQYASDSSSIIQSSVHQRQGQTVQDLPLVNESPTTPDGWNKTVPNQASIVKVISQSTGHASEVSSSGGSTSRST